MNTPSNAAQRAGEITFYLLGILLIVGFVVLYFPRFLGIQMVPPAIRYLVRLSFPKFLDASILPVAVRTFLYVNWATIWAITVNAGIFVLFLAFLPYRTKKVSSKNAHVLTHPLEGFRVRKTPCKAYIQLRRSVIKL